MNVTHRQRHEVERIPNGILHLFFVLLDPYDFHLLSNQISCSYEQTTTDTQIKRVNRLRRKSQGRKPFRGLLQLGRINGHNSFSKAITRNYP